MSLFKFFRDGRWYINQVDRKGRTVQRFKSSATPAECDSHMRIIAKVLDLRIVSMWEALCPARFKRQVERAKKLYPPTYRLFMAE
jgi:hypothetical protein